MKDMGEKGVTKSCQLILNTGLDRQPVKRSVDEEEDLVYQL